MRLADKAFATTKRAFNGGSETWGEKFNRRVSDSLPVHQDSAATIESFLYESIARWEMLKNVLVLDVIHFNNEMLVALEQIPINRQAQYRDHVSNASFVQCFLPP